MMQPRFGLDVVAQLLAILLPSRISGGGRGGVDRCRREADPRAVGPAYGGGELQSFSSAKKWCMHTNLQLVFS